MSRGEQELNCLNFVKKKLNDHSIYFGTTLEDCEQIKRIVLSAEPNPENSRFPDFISEEGFIEHFQISSGKTTRNGSLHKRDIAKFNSDYESGLEEFKENTNKNLEIGVCKSYCLDMEYKEHSYENLVSSMQASWKHHMDGLRKYNGVKKVGIFLIEYNEMALSMIEDKYASMNGLGIGDLRSQECFSDYRLSRDIHMFDFLYEYRDNIQYVIYVCSTYIEIIKVENIFKIKSLLPWEYRIAPMHMTEHRATYAISVPDSK